MSICVKPESCDQTLSPLSSTAHEHDVKTKLAQTIARLGQTVGVRCDRVRLQYLIIGVAELVRVPFVEPDQEV